MTMASREARRLSQYLCWVLLIVALAVLWPVQLRIDRELGSNRDMADVLYMPSGDVVRRLSLGYEGLLADIYWTRVVQYFGRRRLAHATNFDLLGPLLRITTQLDPKLLIAYRFGSVFLAEKPPRGAGQPEEALALLRRGIVANPDYWRLWQDLGFIYYWDLKDYQTAAKVFYVGSQRPGAMVWMRVLAASVAAKGGAIETSWLLWSEIARQAGNDQIRRSAEEHLAALAAQKGINDLNVLLARYQEREGRTADSWQELLNRGYLRIIPKDPSGAPYIIGPDRRAGLSPHSKVDMGLLQ